MTKTKKMADHIPIISSLSEFSSNFDAFIIDLWGVIHDGVTLYPKVIDCLQKIHKTGKPYAMLTNAPRRAEAVRAGMNQMGVPEYLCPIIMSSGEATRLGLEEMREEWFLGVRKTYLHIGPARDDGLLDNLEFEMVNTVGHAGLIVNTGPWGDEETVSDYEHILKEGANAKVKMVCANPDLEVIRGGRRIICAGALAKRYEQLGGDVLYYGKPHQPIYDSCLHKMGSPDLNRVLAIGDSLQTDILGAKNLKIKSLLVIGGIHGEEFGLAAGDISTDAGRHIANVCAKKGVCPDVAIHHLCW